MTTAKPDIAKIREALDVIDELESGVLDDGLGPMPGADEIDAWFVRNHEALAASLREGGEAYARGEYRQGTAAELRAYFVEKYRRRRATST
ncbi:hypothetical protein [Oleomonas cavernae]|uniref:hypothetical protein n=1 Tax=Oleomonas cavernae TaxID=2320859 RepID=UPI001314031F|nr:hypothetical protein [Oleomonas cavernae]